MDTPTIISWGFAFIFALNWYDYHLTNEGLRRGGKEVNPVSRWLISKGPIVWFGAKVVLIPILALSAMLVSLAFLNGALWAWALLTWFFAAILLAVCTNNIRVLRQLGK